MLKITTTLYHTDGIIPPGKDTMRNTYEKQIKLIITILMIVLSCCTFSACSLPGSSDNNSDDQKTELKKHAEKNDNRSPAQITAGSASSLPYSESSFAKEDLLLRLSIIMRTST